MLLIANGLVNLGSVALLMVDNQWLMRGTGLVTYGSWNILMMVLLGLIYRQAKQQQKKGRPPKTRFMKHKKTISLLVLCIALASAFSTTAGLFSKGGPGPYLYQTIRGRTITIYGHGLYQHMSAEVAPQGIAQDYVTLFLGIPLLLLSLYRANKGSLRGRFLLLGVLGYFG